jgi:hypothetical protein
MLEGETNMLDSNEQHAGSGTAAGSFVVYEGDDDGHAIDGHPIGRVMVDEQGYLMIAQADADVTRATYLERVVERLNGKDRIALTSDEAGDEPFTTREVILTRGDAGFVAGLCTYVRTYYGLLLL